MQPKTMHASFRENRLVQGLVGPWLRNGSGLSGMANQTMDFKEQGQNTKKIPEVITTGPLNKGSRTSVP
jgi:hypothetical protein